jgi:Family of unknown function (DUF6580)
MQSAKLPFKLQNVISPVLIIAFAAILRLVPHPPNVAPIAAMALFGGAYLNKKYALVVPLVALFLSDIFLGFYQGMLFVYGSFLLIGVIGLWLRTHKSFRTVILASIGSSILFYLITNFGVWAAGTMYERSLNGLFECYFMGLPFFRNTLLGDLGYVGLFFGGYEIVLQIISNRKSQMSKLQL